MVMNGLDGLLKTQNDFLFDLVNLAADLFDMDSSNLVESAHAPQVSLSHPLVQGDKQWVTWYKMLSLYIVWGWMSYACSTAAIGFLLVNDGGVFYNECYYMFYNGVVWYNPPEPFVKKVKEEKNKDEEEEESGGGLFGGGGNDEEAV